MVNHCPMTSATTIRLDVQGGVARMTFDRPEVLNAGNAQFAADLGRAVAAINARDDVRVVVMTGAGRAFQSGVDLKALAAGELTQPDLIAWEDAMTEIERMDRLVIAGINGHCIGGGLQLALVCDYRLAREDALLGLPAVKECLIPSMALYRLPRLIGLARAKELILLGEPVSARTAEHYGLVNRVVAPADFARAGGHGRAFPRPAAVERDREQASHDARLRPRRRDVPEGDGSRPRRVRRVPRAPPCDGGDPGAKARGDVMLLPTSVVGSHGLPGWVWLAREAMEAGRMGAVDLRELVEDATQAALLDQERAGVDVVTTGEMM